MSKERINHLVRKLIFEGSIKVFEYQDEATIVERIIRGNGIQVKKVFLGCGWIGNCFSGIYKFIKV